MMRRMWAAALVLAALVSPAARAGDDAKKSDSDKATVAVFKLEGALGEKPQGEGLSFDGKAPSNIKDVIERMRKAASDGNVKAVVIMLDGATVGHAQKEELRQAMAFLREK